MERPIDQEEKIAEMSRLIVELSEPCNKLFGRVPKSLGKLVLLPICLLCVAASISLAIDFNHFVRWVLDLRPRDSGPYSSFDALCLVIGFIIPVWVLSRGIDSIDERARKKVDHWNKEKIAAISAEIEFHEKKASSSQDANPAIKC